MAEAEKKNEAECCNKRGWKRRGAQAGAGGGAVYGFGLFGALVFYLQSANSFWSIVMGILKSLVWPAMMVYHLFGFLKM